MQRDFWTKCFHDLTKMMPREAQILQLKWQNFNIGWTPIEIHDTPKGPPAGYAPCSGHWPMFAV